MFFFLIYILKYVCLLKKLKCLFLAVLGLHHCVGLSLAVPSRGYPLLVVCGLLTAYGLRCAASLAAEHGRRGFRSWGSWALEHRLSSCGAWA